MRRGGGVGHRRGGVVHQASACQDPRRADGAPTDEAMRARCWEGQPPAVGEHSATGRRRGSGGGRSHARPAPRGKERDAAIHFAARLPGLDSRRAAACFSSSSPVGAIVSCWLAFTESCGQFCDGAARRARAKLHTNGPTSEPTAAVVAPGDVARDRSGGPRATSSPVHRARAAVPVFSPPRATSLSYNYAAPPMNRPTSTD